MRSPRVSVRRIGNEREHVAIIDDFAADPDALRTAAASHRFESAGRHYPGVKAPLPESYLRDQGPVIGAVLREVFGISAKVAVLEARFSIVVTPAAALTLEQRLPHVDAIEPGRLALVHYLVPARTDGTGFYRHRSTGFETVDQHRGPAYYAALNAELKGQPPASAFIAGDTPLFQQTACVDGVYNRAVLYRSCVLHSGAISPATKLPADPLTGRLTVTGFFASQRTGG